MTVKMNLLKMSGPQIRLCLFRCRPIASKQLNSLLTMDTFSWLGRAVVTHLLWVQEAPGSIPVSGRVFGFDFYAPRNISGEHRVVALSVRPSVRMSHLCPAHNFVIWSQILKLFYRNDHHVVTTFRAQHLGPYLEGQGHSATLQ